MDVETKGDTPDQSYGRSWAAPGGLATREAGGNTVRNVTVGRCAGVCPNEPFDPTPYAAAVARFLLRNPMNQNLPRKFKIAFSGCQEDSGLTPIHDLGARAAIETVDGRQVRGFEILIGRSEEHTSELQSLAYLVCRLLLEKKNINA